MINRKIVSRIQVFKILIVENETNYGLFNFLRNERLTRIIKIIQELNKNINLYYEGLRRI